MILEHGFKPAPAVKILFNVGALLDIPTGSYHTGMHGESLLNGGLGQLTGVVGIGNNFKSTVMNYMMLSAADKILQSVPTSIATYDTEINIHESHLKQFTTSLSFKSFKNMDIFSEGLWSITDKTMYYADEWYVILKDYLIKKKDSSKKITVTLPFKERNGLSNMTMLTPTFGSVDSLSAFETSANAKMQDENELGESGANTMHMKAGMAKTRFLMELPVVTAQAAHYVMMTAHVGKEINMASGPMAPPPTKRLQYLKNGDKIKGVSEQFFFLMSNCYHCYNAAPLINQGTKGPEYPRNPDDNQSGDTDLNIVSLRQLRSKSGPTGGVVQLLVSQQNGVLPTLTEFHFIKESDRFGISGTLQHYHLDLYPDVNVTRTTIRSKIDTDSLLTRAINITSELGQITMLWRNLPEKLVCSPKVLYDDLKALGFDWNVLLKTRGWYTVNNDDHPVPFLSTMDLLRMRGVDKTGEKTYFPYWMNEDKTIKDKWSTWANEIKPIKKDNK